ncbi:hypothetical protein GCM10010136_00010 [Limoniibacter endophyticus]|uniref:Polymerase nucleotidyl transferase domain-containing protein n=1 Tax=Limoniibacter endophyticus TaxID=1565040 RepID=A0A8J3GFT1_9HYPH|nr:hypothetical protein GCM10010136_00010 [Limoniibacter endophyticus]
METTFPELTVLFQRIRETYDPLGVFLYGSHARGDADPDSDWEIKVILGDDAPEALFSPELGWEVQEGSGVYAEVSCARISKFKNDLSIENSIAREISKEGIVLELD